MNNKPIFVTQPYLPPLEEFIPYLQQIWDKKILTNGGPMHELLEQKLCEYLGVEHIVLFNNGTIALITALQALGITGEVITTPYSFVATSHSLIWNNLEPVFVDVDPNTLNIDATKIEAAVTSRTSAIMPVHCYGQRCDVDAIKKVADRYNLKVIYDSAHAFGVKDEGGSILRYGDLSVLSFHATKVFNTFEGGAVVCHDLETKNLLNQLKNFGIVDETTINAAGLNGKMSEINAAFGLLQLKHIDSAMTRRREIDQIYREQLKNIKGIRIIQSDKKSVLNHSYFPILIDSDYPLSRDELFNKLKDKNIFARRYFYPLISNFNHYKKLPSAKNDTLPCAVEAAKTVLCLPIYPTLSNEEINLIVSNIRGSA